MPIFLKFDEIEGDAKATGHAGEIEVTALAYGLTRAVSVGAGKIESSPPAISEVTVTKAHDRASLPLTTALLRGESIGTVQIKFVKTEKEQLVDYLVIEMQDTLVSSLQTSSDGGRPAEQVTFSSQHFRWDDKPPGAKATSFAYDFVANQPL
jgi:type VI secretion system secreted protein Hcp